MLVSALLFDLDNTLLDGGTFPESIRGACRAIVTHANDTDVARVDERDLLDANTKVFSEFGMAGLDAWTLGHLTGAAFSREVWRRTLRACGSTNEALVRFASATHLRLARDTYRLFSDVQALVEAVNEAHIPVALVTNGAADTQREKLDALGLHDWFDAVSISGELGVAKPDREAFVHILDALGVEGETVWHVGDNVWTDVAGAKAAGISAVWLNRDGTSAPSETQAPDLEIRSLTELVPLLRG